MYVTPFLDENLMKEDFTGPGPMLARYTQDGLGSVRQLVVGDTVQNSYAYTSWGVPLNWQERISNRYTHTGREHCSETDDYDFRTRHYNAHIGAFISREKAGRFPPYVYGPNPTAFRDPLGLFGIDVHFYMTYFLALAACICPQDAYRIAAACQGTDEFFSSAALLYPHEARLHFPSSPWAWSTVLPASPEAYSIIRFAFRLAGAGRMTLSQKYILGVGLHVLQDSFAHATYGAPVGHAFEGKGPDRAWVGMPLGQIEAVLEQASDKALAMRYKQFVSGKGYLTELALVGAAKATYDVLKSAKHMLDTDPHCTPVPWQNLRIMITTIVESLESVKDWDPYDSSRTAAVDVWRAAVVLLSESSALRRLDEWGKFMASHIWKTSVRLVRRRYVDAIFGITLDKWVDVVWSARGTLRYWRYGLVRETAGVPAWDEAYYKHNIKPVLKRYEKQIQNIIMAATSGINK